MINNLKKKILLFDIENAPLVTWSWGIHADPSHSTSFVKDDWYIMCWSAKWLGEDDIISYALTDFRYNHKKPNDKKVLQKLWQLLDEADIVVAHNGKKFDCRKANARFIQHGIAPPSPYTVVDTLTIARSLFMFTSNRLGDLGVYLGVGEKMDTGGFDLWKGCMDGDKESWDKMIAYCKQDVILLEKIYLRLRQFFSAHPDVYVNIDKEFCPICGGNTKSKGITYTKKYAYQRRICVSCGKYVKGKRVKNG